MTTVAEIRRAKHVEELRWVEVSYELAQGGEPFWSGDIWAVVRGDYTHRQDERRFFASIHSVLASIVASGLLRTYLKTRQDWGIARRFYAKP